MNTNTQEVKQVVSPVNKTAQERKVELSSLIKQATAEAVSIPADVQAVIEALVGSKVMLGDLQIDQVPVASDWRKVTTKQGKTLYTAMDSFAPRDIGVVAGKRLGIKVSLIIRD